MNNKNITQYASLISTDMRALKYKHKGCVLWLTGLSGSGKSSLAFALEKSLFEQNRFTFVLDGDNLRLGLCRDLGFDEESRSENIRRTAEVAKSFKDAGLISIVALISPLERDREKAKTIIGAENFIEVFCNAPLEKCEERDIKGLYKKARSGQIPNFTGVSSPYETPKKPNLSIDSSSIDIKSSVELVLKYLEQNHFFSERQ